MPRNGAERRESANPWNLIRVIPAEGARRDVIRAAIRQPLFRRRRPSSGGGFCLPSAAEEIPMSTHVSAPTAQAGFTEAFPNSRKVYVEGPHGVRVPMREIALSGDAMTAWANFTVPG